MDSWQINEIRVRMALKTTEHLLEIWLKNNRAQFRPEAFEAIRAVLVERGVTLPAQGPRLKTSMM